MSYSEIIITKAIAETLQAEQQKIIYQLWNAAYPAGLAFDHQQQFENYLKGLKNAQHYFIQLENANAWAMVFERDGERWFALIVDPKVHAKGIGKLLLDFLKSEHPVLNGWVIDHHLYQRKDGQMYRSPLEFYVKNAFEIKKDTRLELPHLSAVKVQWREKEIHYLFKSEHLGFRKWRDADLEAMAQISSDQVVMEFFPSVQDKIYVFDFLRRMNEEYHENGFCYFAVDLLSNGELLGFIGIHEQTFVSDFTPCIDIGWRLKKEVWNRGYATEGAKRCLRFAFEDMNLKKIYSMTPKVNLKSQRIMQKIGMQKVKDFVLEFLKEDERLKDCVLYLIEKD